jgi:membrane associated rhomboid family serine protease
MAVAVASGITILPDVVIPAERSLLQSAQAGAGILVGMLAMMWGLEFVDFLLPMVELDRFGIRPRSLAGLLGVLFAPFLHSGFGHLISNSIPFLVLGGWVMVGGRREFLRVTCWVILIGGGGVWLLGGSRSTHVGASLLIFGYLGFLLSRGWVTRRVGGMMLSLSLFVLYGGMWMGLVPGQVGVSWLGHLCGFLAGIVGAFVLDSETTFK